MKNIILIRSAVCYRGVRTEGEFFINDGTYMVSKEELSGSSLHLKPHEYMGRKDMRSDMDISKEPGEKRLFCLQVRQ